MVIDTSALLAVLFNEKMGAAISQILQDKDGEIRMSTVNLAETLILLSDRQPQLASQVREEILDSSIRFVSPSVRQAEIASEARMRFPLNLGDCFAYALAKDEGCSLLTLDLDFKRTDISLVKL